MCMYSSKTLNPTFENPWITKDYNSAKRKGYHRKKFYAYMFSIISSPKYFFKVFFINLMNFCTHTSTTLYKQCIISFISILNRSAVQLSIFYNEKILEYTWFYKSIFYKSLHRYVCLMPHNFRQLNQR